MVEYDHYKEQLESFILTRLSQGFDYDQIRQELISVGWEEASINYIFDELMRENEINKEHISKTNQKNTNIKPKKKLFGKNFFLLLSLVTIISIVYIILSNLSFLGEGRALNLKTQIDDPLMQSISIIFNEICIGYLHKPFLTTNYPVIEISFKETGENYQIIIKGDDMYITEEVSQNPDIRIITEKYVLLTLAKSNNIKEDFITLLNTGSIKIEQLGKYSLLAKKGYKQFYKNLNLDRITNNNLVGQAYNLNKYIEVYNIKTVLFTVLILTLITFIYVIKEITY